MLSSATLANIQIEMIDYTALYDESDIEDDVTEFEDFCPRCDGSGEGLYDGSSCGLCGGSGHYLERS